MLSFNTPPNDSRGLFHKKILGIGAALVGSFVPGGDLAIGIARKAFSKNQRKASATSAKFGGGGGSLGLGPGDPNEFYNAQCRAEGVSDWSKCGAQRRPAAAASLPFTSAQPFSVRLPCPFPFRRFEGKCVPPFLGDRPGPNGKDTGAPPGSPGGPPSRHTVLTPALVSGSRLRCLAGYVLGRDNLCYFGLPRNSKWRKWRPGRKPKFTGGDLNAIATAASLADEAEEIFKKTNPAKKAVARNYRANWRKPLKK